MVLRRPGPVTIERVLVLALIVGAVFSMLGTAYMSWMFREAAKFNDKSYDQLFEHITKVAEAVRKLQDRERDRERQLMK